MQTADAAVRLQPISGRWETCGVDRLRGVSAEGIKLDANNWGPDTASFTLKRDPGALWPDLLAFTPVEIEIGGVLVWDGFISQTPTSDSDGGSVSVQCKGWQYHLDDDSFEQVWVDSMFSSWKSPTEFQGARPNYYRPNVTAEVGDGAIILGWGKGIESWQNTFAGVIYDAGPEAKISAITATWLVEKGSGFAGSTSGGFQMYARGASSVSALALTGPSLNAFGATGVSMGADGTTKTVGGTFSTPCRYVLLGLRRDDATAVATSNYIAKVTSIAVTGKSSYYTAAAGSTPAKITGPSGEQIVTEALTKAPLINGSPNIQTASPAFNIPNFSSTDGGKTPREYIEQANSYYGFIAKVNPGRSFVFKPKASAPTVAVGRWGGSRFEDASSNSAEEIYNKVVVEGTGTDGASVRVSRYASGVSGLLSAGPSQTVPQSLYNGDFSSVTTGSNLSYWASDDATAATFLRNASSQGEFKIVNGTKAAYSATGTVQSGFVFKNGITYNLTFTAVTNSDPYITFVPACNFGSATDYASAAASSYIGLSNTATITVSWSPASDVNTATTPVTIKVSLDSYPMEVGLIAVNDTVTIDDMLVSYALPTLVDKRGFSRTKRLQVESMVTPALAAQLGDNYLRSHAQTPLKGSISVDGRGARDYLSGATIHPSQLLLEVGERIHLSHRIDPDTGAQGRDGDIAGVSYDHDQQSADVSIDSQRNRFENFISRLAVLSSVGTQR